MRNISDVIFDIGIYVTIIGASIILSCWIVPSTLWLPMDLFITLNIIGIIIFVIGFFGILWLSTVIEDRIIKNPDVR